MKNKSIEPGGWPADFGLQTLQYNLQVLEDSEPDSLMRLVMNGDRTYRTCFENELIYKEIPTKNLFIKMLVWNYTDKVLSEIKNKDTVSKIVAETNKLHLDDDGYVIDRYSRSTYNRNNPVPLDEVKSMYSDLSLNESKLTFKHIKERIYRADEFFSHVREFQNIISIYSKLITKMN